MQSIGFVVNTFKISGEKWAVVHPSLPGVGGIVDEKARREEVVVANAVHQGEDTKVETLTLNDEEIL